MPGWGEVAAALRLGVHDTGPDRGCLWRAVALAADAFGRPLTEADRVPAAELDAAEARLGRRLPAALREMYRLFGSCADLTQSQDSLVLPDRLTVDTASGVDALVFRRENQGCASWAVPLSALGRDDPPTWWRRDGEQTWRPHAARLSSALVEMAFAEGVMAAAHHDNREVGADDIVALAAAFDRLPVPELPFWAGADHRPPRWLHGPDLVLRIDEEAWLWACGRTPEAVRRLRERFPGDWLVGDEAW